MSQVKYVYRLPPCPAYETERQEAWLEEMARKGLILTDQGPTRRGFCFEKAEPRAIRYRILPCQRRTLLNDGGPQPAEAELAADFGWKYHAFHNEFAVFCTEDPNARELETDPQVRAMVVKKHYRKALRQTIFMCLFLAVLLIGILGQGILVYYSTKPVWHSFFWTALFLSLFPCEVPRVLYLRRLKQQLELGEMPPREVPSKKKALWHRICTVFLATVLLCFWISYFLQSFVPWQADLWQPAAQCQEDLSIPTLEELASGGIYDTSTWRVDHNQEIAVRSTVLMKRHADYRQAGVILQGEETVLNGMIFAEYCEMRTEWLAEEMFREMGRYYRRNCRDQIEKLPQLPVDEADAFSNYLLLRQGNKVLKLQLLQTTGIGYKPIPMEEWAARAAEAFIE